MLRERLSATLAKAKQLSWPEAAIFVEAFWVLCLASLAKAVAPFRILASLASRPLRERPLSFEARALTAVYVRRAVLAWARRMPWKPLCLPQGLAVQFMLRRRGIPAVLYVGAAQDGQGHYESHVWVQDKQFFVVGGEVAGRFEVLAKYPADG